METKEPEEEKADWFRLSEAANTYNPALEILFSKGYKVFLYPADRNHLSEFWAIKGGRDFIASDPLQLIGLVTLWEHFGDDWQKVPYPNHFSWLQEITFPEDGYRAYDVEAFTQLVSYFRDFFSTIGRRLPDEVSKKELAALVTTFYRDDSETK